MLGEGCLIYAMFSWAGVAPSSTTVRILYSFMSNTYHFLYVSQYINYVCMQYVAAHIT